MQVSRTESSIMHACHTCSAHERASSTHGGAIPDSMMLVAVALYSS